LGNSAQEVVLSGARAEPPKSMTKTTQWMSYMGTCSSS
jgi:hypothetical protein